MKWVTRDHVHMDRVASPWLIRRFIDPTAEFLFVAVARTPGAVPVPDIPLPADAIPFALPGAEIGPHDAEGSTFRKLMRKYALMDPALDEMALIIESGIRHVLHHDDDGYSVAQLLRPEGVGLDALALGMLYLNTGDTRNIERSMVIYDALYDWCAGVVLERTRADLAYLPIPARWDAIKLELDRTRPWAADSQPEQ